MLTIFTLVITAIAILFCTASASPGVVELAGALLPLSIGYGEMFHMSERNAAYLALPGVYATAFGFMFLYGRQMSSMARSGLFHPSLGLTIGRNQTPHVALIVGSVVGYLMLVLLHFFYPSLLLSLFNICILGSFFVYLNALSSFIYFRLNFSSLHRNFTNPLGIASAVYGMTVFLVAFIGITAFQDDDQKAIILFLVLLAAFSIYYYLIAKKRQFFSPEEQTIMFVTYVIAGKLPFSVDE